MASDVRAARHWAEQIRNQPLHRAPPSPAVFNFHVSERRDLPQANWRVVISGEHEIEIEYGPGVERTDGAIFEGVWDGNFSDFDFDKSVCVYGSGVKFTNDEIVIVPPSHSIDSAFAILDKSDQRFVISNSIVSCISCIDDSRQEELSHQIAARLHIDDQSIAESGVFNHTPLLLENELFIIYKIMYHNLNIKKSMPPVIYPKIEVECFLTYDDYIVYMTSKISKIISNASSSSRRRKLTPICTISAGYDSPATSVLCQRAGVEKFVTIDVNVQGSNDSGKFIADHLGIDCTLCEHPYGPHISNLRRVAGPKELEDSEIFLATQGIGDNVSLKAFDGYLDDAVLFTGTYGDVYWSRKEWRRAGFRLTKPYEKSVGEYRIEKGFAVVPVPAIGMQFPKSIFQLSDHDQMRKWMVGGGYDRPIPRRIIEDAGVPRGAFATEKAAVNPHPQNILAHKKVSFLSRLNRYPPRTERTM